MGPIYRTTAIILLGPVYITGAVLTVVCLDVAAIYSNIEYICTGSDKNGRKSFQDILDTSINTACHIAIAVQQYDNGCI